MLDRIADAYGPLLRPLLFSLPPETAKTLAETALRFNLPWRLISPALRVRDIRLSVELCGMRLDNPVGLAAGFDKNCEMLPSLEALGFGYLTGGTITELPKSGNPKPRMFRLVKEQSLINALGFPNKGLEAIARHLERAREEVSAPVTASVSGATADEIVRCHRRVEPLADAVEINISSPNAPGLRVFHSAPALAEVLGRVNDGRAKPLMVKLPPYSSDGEAGPQLESRETVLGLARLCSESGVDALTVANSRPTADSRLPTGVGGLSGKSVFEDTLRMVSEVGAEVGDEVAINACGGIFTGEDAWAALKAGATTVQLYTGFIYRGPGIVERISRELISVMDREGVASLAAITTTGRLRHEGAP